MPSFKVTDRAGRWVAGRHVAAGQILNLTERQAEHEMRRGHLTRIGRGEVERQPELGDATANILNNTRRLAKAIAVEGGKKKGGR